MKKANLILIASIVLFSLINISLAQAGNFLSTVVYNDSCPRQGAYVRIYGLSGDPGFYGQCFKTNATGQCENSMFLKNNTLYKANATWPDGSTRFGPGLFQFRTDNNGNGNVTLINNSILDNDGNNVGDCHQPQWINQGQNMSLIGNLQSNYLYAEVKSYKVNYTWLSTNETGVWENKTYKNMNGATDWTWSNFTWSNSSFEGILGWKIYYNDSYNGYTNVTNEMSFVVVSLSEIGKAYGSTPGSANWDPYADLNGDNIVNVFDLALASKGSVNQGMRPSQESTTMISVDPENTFIDLVGKNFSVNVNVTDALSTYAFEFKLGWNASLLDITNFTNSTFLSQRGELYCANDTHYNEGWLMFGCTLLEPTINQSYNNGNLAILNFTTLDKGETALHLYDTYLLDDDLNGYTHLNNSGDVTVGIINIISPENTTYHTKIVDLNYSTKISPLWTAYSLDGQTNVTITGNTTLYCLANGNHNIIIYENDAFGNTYSSEKLYFTLDLLAGDVNGDCVVDVLDLSEIGKAYGSIKGSANWDPYADLNCDNIVNVFDLSSVGRNYGKTKDCQTGGQSVPVTTLSVGPEKTSFTNATGTSFNVNIDIGDVEDMYAYEFNLKYDTNILSATNLVYSFLNAPTWVGKKTMDNTKGEIQLGITSWTGAKPKTGKGALATVTFQVKDFGKSNLDLESTKLANYDIKLIGHNVTDGLFINYLPATVDVKPDTFNLNDKGKWITSYINLPLNYDLNNVNISTVKLWYENNYVQAESVEIKDNTLVVKFNRTTLQQLLSPGNVELAITGELFYNNRYLDFRGMDSIRVISK
jgi:hypothetical protein